MKHVIALTTVLVLALPTCARTDTFGSGPNAFEITFVAIGDPGNPLDDSTGALVAVGSVPYEYRMGKYEISRDMMEKASAVGNLGLTMSRMQFVTSGPRPNMPAAGVSWFQAARFVNWLNTSKGFPAAYKFNTQPEDVDYDPNERVQLWAASDPGYNSDNLFRNSLAFYFLPSNHEWHKAAYYETDANGGMGGYWNYTAGSDVPPMPVPSGTAPGTAVNGQQLEDGPADITQAGGLTPYGIMGMGGNVHEWEETAFDLVNSAGNEFRGVRRGRWDGGATNVLADRGGDEFPPGSFGSHVGFRVASVAIPEPSSFVLIAISGLGLFAAGRRKWSLPV